MLLDHADRVCSANPAAQQLFGEDLLRKDHGFLAISRRPRMEKAMSRVRDTGHCQFRETVGRRVYQFDLSRIESGSCPLPCDPRL